MCRRHTLRVAKTLVNINHRAYPKSIRRRPREGENVRRARVTPSVYECFFRSSPPPPAPTLAAKKENHLLAKGARGEEGKGRGGCFSAKKLRTRDSRVSAAPFDSPLSSNEASLATCSFLRTIILLFLAVPLKLSRGERRVPFAVFLRTGRYLEGQVFFNLHFSRK